MTKLHKIVSNQIEIGANQSLGSQGIFKTKQCCRALLPLGVLVSGLVGGSWACSEPVGGGTPREKTNMFIVVINKVCARTWPPSLDISGLLFSQLRPST